jgi:hypothetical protein
MPGSTFTPGDAMFVAHQSVVHTTGSGEPAEPTRTLAEYNVNTPQQLQGVRDRIRNNTQFGLPHFNRSIDPNALKDIATDTVLQDLADLVLLQSFEVGQAMAASVRSNRGLDVTDGGPMQAVAEFTRQNPMSALMIAAGTGMLVGMLFGALLRR